MCCYSNNFVTGITVSVWTVVQTSFHIIWALCGYYFYVCKLKPSHYWLVILYLTYFYKHDCGDIALDSDNIFVTKKEKKHIIKLNSTNADKETLYDIIATILEKAVLPKESNAAWRTHLYIQAFIISDAVWIISSFLLFAGTCFQIKKCISLLFYCPWLVVTASIILLDVVSSVHFGLDILKIHSFTSWLKFIGVNNYEDFSTFNSHETSPIVPILPAISLCVLFSRILVFWIGNIVLFFQIMHVAVLAFQDNLDGKNPRYQRKGVKRNRTEVHDLNLNSSESRIRSWQLFYGAVESTETSSNSSSKSSDRDCNSNMSLRKTSQSSPKALMTSSSTLTRPPQRQESLESYERYISSIRNESSRTLPNRRTYYCGYPDVDDCIENNNSRKNDTAGRNKSQAPWSYFKKSEEICTREQHMSTSFPVNNVNRFRKHQESYANIGTISTEL